jgi:putative oxidoreductase
VLSTAATIIPRVLIALVFLIGGVAKIAGPGPFLANMEAHHIPGILLPPVIALEIGGGLAILIGWRVAIAGAALGAFCILTAVIFHTDFGNRAEITSFLKDLAISGGLLAMALVEFRSRSLAATG